MDLITQIQTYVFHLSRSMLQATHEAHQASGSVPPTVLSSTFDSPSIIDKAGHLMKLLTEADVLMASLPDKITTEEQQMEQVAKLEEENQQAGERWERAQREAALWQARVSRVLTEAAIKQLHTTTTSNDDTTTQEKES